MGAFSFQEDKLRALCVVKRSGQLCFFSPRDASAWRGVWHDDYLPVTSRTSVETVEWMELLCGTDASRRLSYTVL